MIRAIFKKNAENSYIMIGCASVGYQSNDVGEVTMDIEKNTMKSLLGDDWEKNYYTKLKLVGNVPENKTKESLLISGLAIGLV